MRLRLTLKNFLHWLAGDRRCPQCDHWISEHDTRWMRDCRLKAAGWLVSR